MAIAVIGPKGLPPPAKSWAILLADGVGHNSQHKSHKGGKRHSVCGSEFSTLGEGIPTFRHGGHLNEHSAEFGYAQGRPVGFSDVLGPEDVDLVHIPDGNSSRSQGGNTGNWNVGLSLQWRGNARVSLYCEEKKTSEMGRTRHSLDYRQRT